MGRFEKDYIEMNINDFRSEIEASGIAKTSLFEVLVSKPGGEDDSLARDMTMRASSVDMPGRSVTIVESMFTGHPYKIGSGSTISDVNMTIILSEDFREREFFEKWIDKIVGTYRTGDSGNMFNLKYYETYVGSVDITNYDELGDPIYRTKLIDAFPTTIGNISLSWENGAEIAILPITFTCRYYRTTAL